MSVLEARGVWKIYETGPVRVEAVRGVDISVGPGEVVAVMGPSGSGKTTLLTMLGAMLSPSRGEILVSGRPLAGLDAEERAQLRRDAMGYVFQAFNLFAALTARQNVEVGLRLRGRGAAEARGLALEALAQVGLADRADFVPASLSGGQRQRVALARALAGGPRLVLADEPTGSLDAASGRAVMELLGRLARGSGAAVVVVTHDPRMRDHVDRVFQMEDGRLTGERHDAQS